MIGKTVSHYKILEQFGSGGMGIVFKVEDTKRRRKKDELSKFYNNAFTCLA